MTTNDARQVDDAAVRERAVKTAVERRRTPVNEAIKDHLPIVDPERLHEASRYLLDAGGKRLRPTMMLLVGEAIAEAGLDEIDYTSVPDVDGAPVDLMAAAVSVEVIQSFTLIHDDIMDEDPLRRGVPSVHEAYDTETAILAGDTLYSMAFEIMAETDAPPARTTESMRRLAATCTKICEGQSLDVEFEDRTDVTVEEYMEMVEHKTAVLYAASASIPAVLLGADEAIVEALYGYGVDVGRGFQIQDDVLDLTVPSEKLGKQRGSDLVEDKQTLITVHASQQGVDVDALVDAETPEAVTETEVDAAVERLHEAGSIEYARTEARDLIESGKDRLSVLPDSEARDTLRMVADYLIERGY
ncbi:phosphoesterase [Halobacteriales archaeon SW_7_68_16]|nr:MAG: phosphoesterase [Halobacteriales archaeon SW_7_68_16]